MRSSLPKPAASVSGALPGLWPTSSPTGRSIWMNIASSRVRTLILSTGGPAPYAPTPGASFACAQFLELSPAEVEELSESSIATLLSWLDAFPEDQHAPVWLEAYEANYREELIARLSAHRSQQVRIEVASASSVRLLHRRALRTAAPSHRGPRTLRHLWLRRVLRHVPPSSGVRSRRARAAVPGAVQAEVCRQRDAAARPGPAAASLCLGEPLATARRSDVSRLETESVCFVHADRFVGILLQRRIDRQDSAPKAT